MVDNDQSSFEMIPTIDNERSTNVIWDMISTSIGNGNDFSQIKDRIRSFVRDHPLIVSQLDQALFHHFIDHFLKKFLRIQFSEEDREETRMYLQRVINEQYSNIGIILSYFVNDIRLLMLSGDSCNVPWPIRQGIIRSPNTVLIRGISTWIYLKGSEKMTNILFENVVMKSDEKTQFTFSFDEQNLKMLLLIVLFLLVSINVNSIAFVINIIGIIVFVIVVFVYLKRFV